MAGNIDTTGYIFCTTPDSAKRFIPEQQKNNLKCNKHTAMFRLNCLMHGPEKLADIVFCSFAQKQHAGT